MIFVDESHQTVPQIGGMYEGDRSRKQTLVDYGFRLPSALDNRPLRFDEFLQKVPQMVFVSATPGAWELRQSARVAEQLIRPTYLVDPEVELRPTKNQIDDLLNEIRRREEVGERVLVTTLTKKMSEDLTDYLLEAGVKARYLHSEIDTLERIQIIRELRLGEYDVLVGVNLLREGLDLPEVSLVAILDADKEGFLRGRTALVQTIGRAARHVNGRVLMYADKMTEAIKGAIEETNRRRTTQLAYNEEHGTKPISVVKGVSDIAEFLALEQPHVPSSRRRRGGAKVEGMSREELERLVITLEEEMFQAAEELRFEYAAKLRDELKELRRDLNALAEADPHEPGVGAGDPDLGVLHGCAGAVRDPGTGSDADLADARDRPDRVDRRRRRRQGDLERQRLRDLVPLLRRRDRARRVLPALRAATARVRAGSARVSEDGSRRRRAAGSATEAGRRPRSAQARSAAPRARATGRRSRGAPSRRLARRRRARGEARAARAADQVILPACRGYG